MLTPNVTEINQQDTYSLQGKAFVTYANNINLLVSKSGVDRFTDNELQLSTILDFSTVLPRSDHLQYWGSYLWLTETSPSPCR